MYFVVIRECLVLLLGVAVSFLASLFGNAGQDFGALVAAILVPIAFCLARAALARLPSAHLSATRRVAARCALGFAMVALLVFEMGVALLAGAPDIPVGVWFVLAVLAVGYVGLFVAAHGISRTGNTVSTSKSITLRAEHE